MFLFLIKWHKMTNYCRGLFIYHHRRRLVCSIIWADILRSLQRWHNFRPLHSFSHLSVWSPPLGCPGLGGLSQLDPGSSALQILQHAHHPTARKLSIDSSHQCNDCQPLESLLQSQGITTIIKCTDTTEDFQAGLSTPCRGLFRGVTVPINLMP